MYQIEATVSEDLSGWTVDVVAWKWSCRQKVILSTTTWLIGQPGDDREAAHRRVQARIVGFAEKLAEDLRRVASGVSRLED